MRIRHCLTAGAAALALFGLSACGDPIADTVTAAATTGPTPTPPPLSKTEPPLPLPETDPHRSIIDRAYLDTLAEEGIAISDERALELADQVCGAVANGGGLMDAIDVATTNSSLSHSDASFLAGAAYGTCLAETGEWP